MAPVTPWMRARSRARDELLVRLGAPESWPWIERVTDDGVPVARPREGVDYLNNDYREYVTGARGAGDGSFRETQEDS